MAFPLKDVRFTTRRGGDEPTLYPRLLRDRSVLPKVDIAIQYFESMLGSERRELDPEALVHFFGDHKLARCMVAALARGYRYRPRELEQVVTQTALRRLRRAGIDSPRRLRLALFDRVNASSRGFLARAEREAHFAKLEAELRLRRGELERLLYLDAEEHAVLTRVGEPPRPADVVAQHNFGVLETLLRHAELVELAVAEPRASARAAVAQLCAANDVDGEVGPRGSLLRLRLRGRQDALGGWTRHGRKLARTLIQILERARGATVEGLALVRIRERRAQLRLTTELLDVLGGAPAPSIGWDEEDDEAGRLALAATAGLGGLARSARGGWSVRRSPEPQAWAAGVVVPDLLLRRGPHGALLCAVRSARHGERLALIARGAATGEPLVFVGGPGSTAPLRAVGAATIEVAEPSPRELPARLGDALAGRDRAATVPDVA